MLSGFCGMTRIDGPFGLFNDASALRIEYHKGGQMSKWGQGSSNGEAISLNVIATGANLRMRFHLLRMDKD